MRVNVKNLKKYYGTKCVVDDVNFEFQSGEIFCLIGRNGSGKTSTIRMMLGTLSKNAGEVKFDDMNLKAVLKNTGYLSEERGMFVKDKILDQLVYFAMLKGMKKKEAIKSAEEWLECLGILNRRNEKLENLSKGNQQKVQIIASLIHNPEIIIFDEPFSGLDPINTEWLLDLLLKLKKKNKCILISSHQLNLIEGICDKIAIISNSKLVYFGTLNDLKKERGGTRVLVTFPDYTNEDIVKQLTYLKKVSNLKYGADLSEQVTFKKIITDILEKKLDICSVQMEEISLNEIFIKWEESV